MLFFNLIFHFPTWCTDPAKIGTFQHEYIADLQQSVTFKCEAEGNPPPTYTWTPCDPEQVCNKNTLQISQVLKMPTINAEWPICMEMIQKLPMFVSHMYTVVMYL